MHRRIAWVIVAVVLATLLVATTTIGLLSALRGPGQARRQLVDEAAEVERRLDRPVLGTTAREALGGAGCGAVTALREVDCGLVRLDGAVQLNARNVSETALPARIDPALLEGNRIASGRQGRVVWAIIPVRTVTNERGVVTGRRVIVLSRRTTSPLSSARGWFVLAGVLTVGLGLIAARLLSRRLTRPLVDAQAATQRIAAGDLSVRLDDAGRPDDELANLARSINTMAGALERSRVLEQQFLLSVSHDLRTPLTSIRGYAEALGDGTLTDVSAGATVIEREARRLERLVRDLLDLAKLDARSFRFSHAPVDLAEVATSAVAALRPDAAGYGVELVAAPVPPVGGAGPTVASPTGAGAKGAGPIVSVDRDRIGQVAANLVENALKYAIARVEVSVGADAASAWLIVADDGPGIAPEDQPHVFERLYVSKHAPVRKEAGSGLGLAIVHELVSAMGGRVWAASNTPRGTCMVVSFPRAAPIGTDAGALPAAASPSGPEART